MHTDITVNTASCRRPLTGSQCIHTDNPVSKAHSGGVLTVLSVPHVYNNAVSNTTPALTAVPHACTLTLQSINPTVQECRLFPMYAYTGNLVNKPCYRSVPTAPYVYNDNPVFHSRGVLTAPLVNTQVNQSINPCYTSVETAPHVYNDNPVIHSGRVLTASLVNTWANQSINPCYSSVPTAPYVYNDNPVIHSGRVLTASLVNTWANQSINPCYRSVPTALYVYNDNAVIHSHSSADCSWWTDRQSSQ